MKVLHEREDMKKKRDDRVKAVQAAAGIPSLEMPCLSLFAGDLRLNTFRLKFHHVLTEEQVILVYAALYAALGDFVGRQMEEYGR